MYKQLTHVCLLPAAVALVAVLASCKTDGRTSVLKTDDESAIYTAVVLQLCSSFVSPSKLYIVRNTQDTGSATSGQESDSTVISRTVQSRIGVTLDIETIWIDEWEDADFEEGTRRVKDGGGFIILGNIYPQEDGSVQVDGYIYRDLLYAFGAIYILEKTNGVWQITGTVVTWEA